MIKKNVILFFIVVVISLLVPAVVKYDMESNYEIIQEEQIEITNDPDMQYNIDEITVGQYIKIRGWAMNLSDPIVVFDTQVGLWDEESGQIIIIPSVPETRKDVNKKYKNYVYNYKNSGFYTKINTKLLESRHKYKIIIFLNGNIKKCIDTKKSVLVESGEDG